MSSEVASESGSRSDESIVAYSPTTKCQQILDLLRIDLSAASVRGQEIERRLSSATRSVVIDEAMWNDVQDDFPLLRRDRSIGQQALTEGQVRDACAATGFSRQADVIVLALRIAVALVGNGLTSTDAEEKVLAVCNALGCSNIQLEFSMRSLHLSVLGGPMFVLKTPKDIVLDRLAAVKKLSTCLIAGTGNARTALEVLDEILAAPLPYSPLIQMLAFEGLCTMAAIAAFMGTYEDAFGVALITPFVILTQKLCGYACPSMEPFFVPVMVGVVTPVVWKFIEVSDCNVPVLYLSPLLVYLPGSQLTYGAYEIVSGHLVNGASQLASCVIRCMYMALALMIGWQAFGHNAAVKYTGGKTGAVASLLPADMTCQFSGPPWQEIFLGWNFLMLFLAFVGLNIRIRSMLEPGLIGYVSLLLYISLTLAPGLEGVLPSRIIDCIGLFVASFLACFYEHFSGIPSITSIVPVLLMLAPGSEVLLSVLRQVQIEAHVKDASSAEPILNLVLQGVSYAIGLQCAKKIWTPLLHKTKSGREIRQSGLGVPGGTEDLGAAGLSGAEGPLGRAPSTSVEP